MTSIQFHLNLNSGMFEPKDTVKVQATIAMNDIQLVMGSLQLIYTFAEH